MGKTSSAVKDRWNASAYDEIKVRVPKGKKDVIKAAADRVGESLNAFVYNAIQERMATVSQSVAGGNSKSEGLDYTELDK